MDLFTYPTTLDLLNALKAFCRQKFSKDTNLFPTIKKGIMDSKDIFPILIIEPVSDEIELLGSNGLFIIRRLINFSVYVNDFNKNTAQDKVRKIADKFKAVLKPIVDDWMLTTIDGKNVVFNVDFDAESFNEPYSNNRQWVYSYSYPVIFSSYYQYPQDKVVTPQFYSSNYDDLLQTLFLEAKTNLRFKKYFRDVVTPTDLANLPGLSIMYDSPDTDRGTYSAEENFDATIDFQVYDFLATKEIALDNHLKNVYSIVDFILKNEDLKGKLDLFQISNINYGILSEFQKPIYASIVTTNANFHNNLY